MQIQLPHDGWTPRDYQKPLFTALLDGSKRSLALWARRHGKDEIALHWAAYAAHARIGAYLHLLPLATQARSALWNMVNPRTHRRRFLDAFPLESIEAINENNMFIRFKNGSTWTLGGSDNYHALIGTSYIGITWSEWSRSDPDSYTYLSPILAENDGWALFITTPLGRNHCWKMYDTYRNDPNWFVQLLPASVAGHMGAEKLAAEKNELIALNGKDQGEALYEQEYEVSFAAANIGAYFGREISDAEKPDANGLSRICNVPHNPSLPVFAAFDIGIHDATSCWMIQMVGKELHAIDYFEDSGHGIEYYIKLLRERPYTYGAVILPHDAAQRQLSSGTSTAEVMRRLGVNNIRVLPQQKVREGIDSVRRLLPMMWFDKTKCKRGIEALQQYSRTWDDTRKVFSDTPRHDQYSHGADAMRYFAVSGVRNATASDGPIDYSRINRGVV